MPFVAVLGDEPEAHVVARRPIRLYDALPAATLLVRRDVWDNGWAFTAIVMLLAADPLSKFIAKNPTIVMLALGFLLMIGMTLIADGFGYHVPKGYIYAAMGFSALVEGLNMLARRKRAKPESKGS